ncbi:MAG TPA: hypothetical protein VGX00_01915 [Thermoplasmata archaeon]|nr:hypothetical protein [Thermoplasmata archaeon]
MVGPNIIFLASYFLLPIGFYLLALELGIRRVIALPVALGVGSPLNPFIFQSVVGGGEGYGLWAFLLTISIWLLVRLAKGPRKTELLLGSAIAFGLSMTPPEAYLGLLMGAPFVAIFLVRAIRPFGPGWQACIRDLGTFILTSGGIAASTILPALSAGVAVTAHQSTLSSALDYVVANATFTFRPFGPFQAILYGSGTYLAPLAGVWELVLIAAICIPVFCIRSYSSFNQFNTLAFLSAYLVTAGLIVGFSSGFLIPLYSRIHPIDLLDSPFYFVWIQTISLGPLAALAFEDVAKAMERLPSSIKFERREITRAAGGTGYVAVVYHRRRGPSPMVSWIAAATACLLVLPAGVLNFSTATSYLEQAQGPAPYANESFLGVGSWYESVDRNLTGYILTLPFTYAEYNKFTGFIPPAELWYIPFLGTSFNPEYNSSTYSSTMNLLVNGSYTSFARTSGLEGVEYLIVDGGASEVTLTPGYLGATVTMQLSVLLSGLKNSGAFREFSINKIFYGFANRDYVRPGEKFGAGAQVIGARGGTAVTALQLLANPSLNNLSGWDSYLSSSVTPLGNGSAELSVNSSSKIGYVLFSTLVPLVFSATNGATVESPGTGAVRLDPNLTSARYSVSLAYGVSGSGAELAMYLYWYNVSSPTNFFGQFNVTSLLRTGPSAGRLNSTFLVPEGGQRVRLILSLSNLNGTSVTARVGDLGVWQTIVPRNLDEATDLQYQLGSEVSSAAWPSKSSILVASPLSRFSGGCFGSNGTVLWLGSAALIDSNDSPGFSIPFTLFQSMTCPDTLLDVGVILRSESLATATINSGKSMGQATIGPENSLVMVNHTPGLPFLAKVGIRGNATLTAVFAIFGGLVMSSGTENAIYDCGLGSLLVDQEAGGAVTVQPHRPTLIGPPSLTEGILNILSPISFVLALALATVGLPRLREITSRLGSLVSYRGLVNPKGTQGVRPRRK